ncbi:hypothetical protein Hanom_Chr12g01129651 [Helianthus anomalus]
MDKSEPKFSKYHPYHICFPPTRLKFQFTFFTWWLLQGQSQLVQVACYSHRATVRTRCQSHD